MGLLDRRDSEIKRNQEREDETKRLRANAPEAAKQAAELAARETRFRFGIAASRFLVDSQAVIQLVTGLPRANYDEYFDEVSQIPAGLRNAGYKYRIGVYTSIRPHLEGDPRAESLNEAAHNRNKAMQEAHLTRGRGTLALPGEIDTWRTDISFMGDAEANSRKGYGLLDAFSKLSEPHEVGVGVLFRRKTHKKIGAIEAHACNHGQECPELYIGESRETDTDSVFLRFYGQSRVIITSGSMQQRFKLKDLKQLDNAMDEAFTDTMHVLTRENGPPVPFDPF